MGWAADNGRLWGMRGGAYRIVQSVAGEERAQAVFRWLPCHGNIRNGRTAGAGLWLAWAGQFQKADWLSEVQVLCSLKTSVSW